MRCPGSSADVETNNYGELPHDGCYRLCPACDRLQRVKDGRLIDHEREECKAQSAGGARLHRR